MDRDRVDEILGQWHRARPDLDASAIAVIGRISRASRAIDVRLNRNYARFGLSDGEFDALATLRRSAPPHRLSPTELGDQMMVTSGAVSKRVDRLETAGLVRRTPSPTDGRARVVELTDAGYALIDEALAAHLATEEHLLAPLDDASRDQLASLLRRLMLTLERDDGPPPPLIRP